jgi:flagellar P-ring protein precursor FlgI
VNPSGTLHLQLRDADFTTSARVAQAVNQKFAADGAPVAHAENSALVTVAIPTAFASRSIEFLSELEKVTVDADRPARVVVNERTGTIVMGGDVHISPVAIMHGNLTVQIQTTFAVAQPAPLSRNGTTQVVPQTDVTGKEDKARNVILKQGATIEELVRALVAIGSTPRDIIAILQNLRAAGALEAELEVI